MQPNATGMYITGGSTSSGLTTATSIGTNSVVINDINGYWINDSGLLQNVTARQKTGIHPELYFKYIKSKFGVLEKMKLDARLKKLEKAFDKAVDNGQTMLGEKLMGEIVREAKESAMYAKGFKHFIEKEDLDKHKRNIRGGHISDTRYDQFTRVIPKDVLEKKKKSEGLYDGYVIYHVWDEEAEKKRTKDQKMSSKEKSRMRDPVLFGVIKESNRLYFVADWEDDLCDLTFEEIVDELGKEEKEVVLPREPKLN